MLLHCCQIFGLWGALHTGYCGLCAISGQHAESFWHTARSGHAGSLQCTAGSWCFGSLQNVILHLKTDPMHQPHITHPASRGRLGATILGNLFQCLPTRIKKMFFLIFNFNFPFCDLRLLCLVLSPESCGLRELSIAIPFITTLQVLDSCYQISLIVFLSSGLITPLLPVFLFKSCFLNLSSFLLLSTR